MKFTLLLIALLILGGAIAPDEASPNPSAGTDRIVRHNYIITSKTPSGHVDTWRIQRYDVPPNGIPYKAVCDELSYLTDLDAVTHYGDPMVQRHKSYGYKFTYAGTDSTSGLFTWERRINRIRNVGPVGVTFDLYCQIK